MVDLLRFSGAAALDCSVVSVVVLDLTARGRQTPQNITFKTNND